jgi:hypothetical protein
MDVLAGEVVGVFAHVEGSDQNGSRRFKPFDQGGIAPGRCALAVDLGARTRRQFLDIEQILDRKRHAGERSKGFLLRPILIDHPGACDRTGVGDGGEAVKNGIA